MNTATTPAAFGEALETFVDSGKLDYKGRRIGFSVGLNDNGADFYAWVQSARGDKSGGFSDFGVRQRSRRFDSQEAATTWAYATAHERIAKLN